MEFILKLFNSIHFIFSILTAIASFILWKKVGFKAPNYLHILAFLSGCIGVLLAYVGHASGAEQGHKAIWPVIGFPVATYFIFGFFGGGYIMADREQDNERKP